MITQFDLKDIIPRGAPSEKTEENKKIEPNKPIDLNELEKMLRRPAHGPRRVVLVCHGETGEIKQRCICFQADADKQHLIHDGHISVDVTDHPEPIRLLELPSGRREWSHRVDVQSKKPVKRMIADSRS